MNPTISSLNHNTLEFTSHFGFLTKEIFFRFFCRKSQRQQYRDWQDLSNSGLFMCSRRDGNLLYLSKKGRRYFGEECAAPRPSYMIDHDAVVAELLLGLECTGLVIKYWTETELKKSCWDAHQILGCNQLLKFPDLVMDIRTLTGSIRIALEVEFTAKSYLRYQQAAASYSGMKNIGLVIYVHNSDAIANAIKSAFSKSGSVDAKKIPALIPLAELKMNGLECPMQFAGNHWVLDKFLLALTKFKEFPANKKWHAHDKPLSSFWHEEKKEKIKNRKIKQEDAGPAPNPIRLASFRDHPHPTSRLIEGGHEPGDGVGQGPGKEVED